MRLSRAAVLLVVAVAAAAALPALPAEAAGRTLLQQATVPAPAPPISAQGTLGASAVYFPLTSSNLGSSWAPNGASYAGQGFNVAWEQDPVFGEVLSCSQERQSYVSIPGLQYGQAGPFGLSFWAKLQPAGNMSMDYAYSHTNALLTDFAFDPNEISFFAPERYHPDFGVVRAIVRDSTDVQTNGTGDLPFYVDSNGCVADPYCATPTNASLFSAQGSWHLLGLSTRPEGGKGFRLYIDGEMVSEVSDDVLYVDAEGYAKAATGGGPMNLTGNITLCARSDLEPTRFFTGSIAHLFIWDKAVTAEEMRQGCPFMGAPSWIRLRNARTHVGIVGMQNQQIKEREMAQIYLSSPLGQSSAAASEPLLTTPGAAVGSASAPDAPSNCTTPCQDYQGLSMCRTGNGELVVCRGGGGPPAEAVAAVAGVPAQPASDCITECGTVDGVSVCFTGDEEPRPCTPLPASPPLASPSPVSTLAGPPSSTQGRRPGIGNFTIVQTTAPAPAPDSPLSDALSQLAASLAQPSLAPAPDSGLPAATTAQPPAATTAQPPSATTAQPPSAGAAQLAGHPLCSAAPLQGVATVQDCGQSYVCAALSREQLAEAFGAALPLKEGDIGVCAYAPGGRLMVPSVAQVPVPAAFFPLSAQTLESFPLADYSGTSASAGIVQDPLFGAVLQCTDKDQDMVALDPVQYGRIGAFSVNLWVKPGNMSGDTMAYLFSHRGTDGASSATSNTGWGPNQVQIYLPRPEHPAFGVVRAYVKDYNDEASATWLDSDGSIAYPGGPRGIPPAFPPYDGDWHMITITSQPANTSSTGTGVAPKGYRMYLDGRLVNEMQEGVTHYSAEGIEIPVDGGDPILLSGNPVLCARSDDPSDRHFNGQLAYLGLYDVALQPEHIGLLYSAVASQMASTPLPAPGSAPPTELPIVTPRDQQSAPTPARYTMSGRPCQFPALWNGAVVEDCIDIAGQLSCQVTEGEWEACAGVSPAPAPAPAPSGVPTPAGISSNGTSASSGESGSEDARAWQPRFTIDGQECVFPATWEGQVIQECVPLQAGGEDMCRTATGAWKQCAPLSQQSSSQQPTGQQRSSQSSGNGTTADLTTSVSSHAPIVASNGAQCQLPLDYNGVQVDSCVSVVGVFVCWGIETDTWEACPDNITAAQPEAGPLGLTAAAVSMPVVPLRSRTTVQGASCKRPIVIEGELIDDCVSQSGTWMCPIVDGSWRECDFKNEAPPTSQPGKLFVAQRFTASSKPCLLPAVQNGFLFFDCAVETSSNGSSTETCPTQDAAWEECSVVGGMQGTAFDPKPISPDALMNRTAPGQLGMLCLPMPAPDQPASGCAQGLGCVPLPSLSSNSSTNMDGLGYCAQLPQGGAQGGLHYLQDGQAPTPLALFPLTGGSTDSLLLPAYTASLSGMPLPAWVPDPDFHSVVNCTREDQSAVLLEPVPYATDGPFAVSLWMRRTPGANFSGDAFSYLYSHAAPVQQGRTRERSPNQMSIYMPDADHESHGVVRVIVRDGDDRSALVWLDSDGTIGNNGPDRKPQHADLNEGGWHMITVSTLTNTTQGFALFVDGVQVGALAPGAVTADGGRVDATGGQPAAMSGDIHLCARHDMDVGRFFSGSLAHLMLFNQALTPEQVSGMYETYSKNATVTSAEGGDPGTAVGGLLAPSSDPSGGDGGLTPGEITGIVIASLGGAIAVATGVVLAATRYRKQVRGESFERYKDDDAAFQQRSYPEAGVPPVPGGGSIVPPAALPAAPLAIQLSSGKSLSMGRTELDSLPAYHSALSDVSSMAPTYTGLSGVSNAPRLPSTASGPGAVGAGATSGSLPRLPTNPSGGGGSVPAVGSGGGAGSDVSQHSAASDVSVEPGRRGLFRNSSARVVLPQVQEDPRSPFEP